MEEVRRTCATALLALTLVACAGTSDPASAPRAGSATTSAVAAPQPVGGLEATVGTSRLYALRHAFGLGLRNVGNEPITIRQIQLVTPLYTVVPFVDEGVVLQPGGRRFVLPVPYGAAQCDGDDTTDPNFAAVVVLDNGEHLQLGAAEDDPGSIGRLHDRECAAHDIRERVELGFGDQWTTQGNDVSGELVLAQRHPGDPVAVDDAVGSVIFTIRVDADRPPILAVTDDEPRAAVPVVISATRCDPHALAESKRSFIFLTWVTVGDSDPVPVELEPTGAVRAALEAVLHTCSA